MSKPLITRRQIAYKPEETKVFIDGEYEFTIYNETELNNIRIAAVAGKWTDRVEFHWNDHIIKMNESGDLLSWPKGWHDQHIRQFATLIKLRRGDITPIQAELITN